MSADRDVILRPAALSIACESVTAEGNHALIVI
jgi:hypothetical protein